MLSEARLSVSHLRLPLVRQRKSVLPITAIIIALLLGMSSNIFAGTIRLKDEGVTQGYPSILDFIGSGVTATRTGTEGDITFDFTSIYLELDGSNANSNIDIGTYDFTADVGTFNSLILGADENITLGSSTIQEDSSANDLVATNDFLLEEAHPWYGWRDTDTNTGFIAYVDESAAASPWQGWGIWDVAFAGSVYSLARDTPIIHIDTSNQIQFYGRYIFPDTAPTDNYILKYDLALGRMAWEVDATGAVGADTVGATELDDGTDTPAADDVVVVDPADTTQFKYIALPDSDAAGKKLVYDTTAHTFSSTDETDPAVDTANEIEAILTNDAIDFGSGAVTSAGGFVGDLTGDASGSSGSCTGNAATCTTASAGDAAVDFFGVGVDAVTDTTTCTDVEGTKLSITGTTLNCTETDDVVGAVSGIVKADGGGNISAATANTDYEPALTDEASLYTTLSDVSKFWEDGDSVTGAIGSDEVYASGWGADSSVPEKDDIYDYLHQMDTDDDGSVDTVDDLFLKLGGDIASAGTYNFGSASVILEVPNSTADTALGNAGEINLNATDDQLSCHGGATGEAQGEVSISLLRHISATFDPAAWYDQESTYRVLPLFYVGDDAPEGITITEWRVNYVAGDPTTELDADLCFDTGDWNPADNMTVMDVLDTTAGASTADTGFDSATASNASRVYIRFGADPTDANVVIAFDLWFYNEED